MDWVTEDPKENVGDQTIKIEREKEQDQPDQIQIYTTSSDNRDSRETFINTPQLKKTADKDENEATTGPM